MTPLSKRTLIEHRQKPEMQTNNCIPGKIRLRDMLQLVRCMVELSAKTARYQQVNQRIEALKQTGMIAVSGEESFLRALSASLHATGNLLQELAQMKMRTRAEVLANLAQVQTLLADVKWELLEEYQEELAEKENLFAVTLESLRERLAQYRANLEPLHQLAREAQKAQAPLRTEIDLYEKLNDLSDQAERDLRERKFDHLLESLAQLDRMVAQLDKEAAQAEPTIKGLRWLANRIHTATRQAGKFAAKAELLLLQTTAKSNWGGDEYEYTVLLRTPSRPGMHGVNVRNSSILVEQDRAAMNDAIDKITNAVKEGLVRDVTPPADAQAQPTDDELRTFAAGDDQVQCESTLDVSGYIREMGDLMYRIFMPEEMQKYLKETVSSLTITTNDLELPWEFMYCDQRPADDAEQLASQADIDTQSFLCLNRPVARMPMGRAFPTATLANIQYDGKLDFLLICSDPDANLPGARNEINYLATWLAQSAWADQIRIDVLAGPDASGQKLNQALRSKKYDVIHYSGHAFFDEKNPERSGLLLHNHEIFFAQKIRRLLVSHPLVFLNACNSARIANEQELTFNLKKAEGLASSFIYGGALGCIGSLWPIYDEPAARFAVEFYKQVLEGYMIGEAMRMARCEIKKKDPITWAAFVLYGDPTFRLVE